MQITNRKLFLIATIFGLIATLLIYLYLGNAESEVREVEPTVEVVVAKMLIPEKTTITRDMIELKELKVSSVPPSTFSNINELIGRTVKENIYVGEPIINERIADDAYSKNHLVYSIPKGYRAITLQYNPVMGVAGFVQPGDYVDVVGTYDTNSSPDNNNISKIILQNVLVLAVGANTGIDLEQKNTTEIQTVTLAVLPRDAEKITYTEQFASIKLLLRPLDDSTKPSTTGTNKDNILKP